MPEKSINLRKIHFVKSVKSFLSTGLEVKNSVARSSSIRWFEVWWEYVHMHYMHEIQFMLLIHIPCYKMLGWKISFITWFIEDDLQFWWVGVRNASHSFLKLFLKLEATVPPLCYSFIFYVHILNLCMYQYVDIDESCSPIHTVSFHYSFG